MKPSQIAMLEDLSKCWMTRRERDKLEYVNMAIRWRGESAPLDGHDTYWLRRLWNLYQMQIRAIKKNGAKK